MRSLNLLVRMMSACLLLAGVWCTAGWAQTTVAGTWSGSFEITQPDGTVHQDTAYLVLKQAGASITGTVGPNEDQRFNITSGTITGSDIQLSAATDDGGKITFRLRLEGTHIKGDVSGESPEGKFSAKIDVTRVAGKAARVSRPPAFTSGLHLAGSSIVG